MQQVLISLTSTEQIQRFVKVISPLSGEFELISNKHILDARSMMGLFSLDLSRPVMLKVYDDCAANLSAIAPFLSNTEDIKHE